MSVDAPLDRPGPPARPRTKGNRTRRRLLDLAVRRFAADGFRRTSVAAIARDATVTPAAVYAYFDGKEALFHAAVDADAAALIERSRPPASGASFRDRWIGMIAALDASLDDHPLARRVLAGREPDVIGRLLDLPSLASLRGDLAGEIRSAQATGEVRPDVDPDELALGFETLVLALTMARLQLGPEGDAPDRAAAAVAVLDAATRPGAHA